MAFTDTLNLDNSTRFQKDQEKEVLLVAIEAFWNGKRDLISSFNHKESMYQLGGQDIVPHTYEHLYFRKGVELALKLMGEFPFHEKSGNK